MIFMTFESARVAIVRTLCFYEAIGYAPTLSELLFTLDMGPISTERAVVSSEVYEDEKDVILALQAFDALRAEKSIFERFGRVALADTDPCVIETVVERDMFQPRKRRRARRIAAYLARLSSIRFVALANTTALGYARDAGDLDFFVIARAGTIWTSRLFGGLPFRILGMMPSQQTADDDQASSNNTQAILACRAQHMQRHRVREKRDEVCLSYWITDDALDLSLHHLPGDDPYFRYWFLSLLPLFDDGVSRDLWQANATLRARHPFARPWMLSSDIAVHCPRYRLPTTSYGEPIFRWAQARWFPSDIQHRMNKDTGVIVNDQTLKFHVTDRRETYRQRYVAACARRCVAA